MTVEGHQGVSFGEQPMDFGRAGVDLEFGLQQPDGASEIASAAGLH